MSEQVSPGIENHEHRKAPPPSDEELMLLYTRGDAGAFDALFLSYKKPIFQFFFRRIGDRTLAEELTQDTFVAVLGRVEQYQPTALFRTYLYAIAYRTLRSFRRKAFFRAGFSAPADLVPQPSSNPSLELNLLIRDAVRRLNQIDREVLLLREFEQLSYLEIASVLNLPVNTVRSRLFRARIALGELLTDRPVRPLAGLSITKEQA